MRFVLFLLFRFRSSPRIIIMNFMFELECMHIGNIITSLESQTDRMHLPDLADMIITSTTTRPSIGLVGHD
jgi:hypothetical protein